MPVLRPCSTALATALASGEQLYCADLFEVTLQSGTVHYWTSWAQNLVVGAATYLAGGAGQPFVDRSRWNVVNTMEIPQMEVRINADNSAFGGGSNPNIKLQAHNGLFDGATFILSRAFMATPGDTTTLGIIALFYGDVGAAQIIGTTIALKVKGRNNKLAMSAPRNTYQAGCLHTFCDTGCTLSKATYTASFAVGSSPAPSATFIPWASAPGTPTKYLNGVVSMTSGATDGQTRTIVAADSTGLTLAYPFYGVPATGDAFTALQGCDKTLAACTGYSNLVNFRGFPYVPTPDTSGNGSF